MPKYGRGLNREVMAGVNRGDIPEPFTVADVRRLAQQQAWPIPETYIRVCLANASSETHSPTYKKYFVNAGEGRYNGPRKLDTKHANLKLYSEYEKEISVKL